MVWCSRNKVLPTDVYIYIYIERERDRESTYIYIYMHIYIYIYVSRERERVHYITIIISVDGLAEARNLQLVHRGLGLHGLLLGGATPQYKLVCPY